MTSVAIVASLHLHARAEKWAKQFNIPLQDENFSADYLLRVTEKQIEFISSKEKQFSPIVIDFLQGKMGFRSQENKKEFILKAVGVKENDKPTVLDLTAGWGRDAFMLASSGCCVTMLERSPVMALLLEEALERLFIQQDKITSKQFSCMHVDAEIFLKQLSCFPDVIYLDPMYPEQKKSALVKKEMRVLRELVGEDDKSEALFLIALQKAKKRVVVKRPLQGNFICDKKPDCQFLGRSTRFDVYFT